MKKLNTKTAMFSLSATTLIAAGVIFFSQSGGAATPVTEDNIGLAIDKLDKDTLKLSLSNVIEIPKALQFSIQLEGDVYFNEESLKWLVTNTNNSQIQKNIKLSEDKKTLEFLIVSNEALKKSSGTIEIGEIDIVSPNNKAVQYKLTSKVQSDGTGYKYVADTTNKQMTGPKLYLENNGVLTYNTAPTLTLIDSPKIVEGKIMLTVGDSFTEEEKLSYVNATDEEDEKLTVTVEGNVDTRVIGSYSLTYKVTDSLNETATLIVPVIVENQVEEVSNPVISGVRQTVELKVGDKFDVLEGIEAIDHTGYKIDVKVTGDYEETLIDGVVTKTGVYTIQYDAQDRWGNPAASETTTLIVSEKVEEPSQPEEPEQPEYTIPDSIKDLIDENIVLILSGNGTKDTPLVLQVLDSTDASELQSMIESFKGYTVIVERQVHRSNVTYSITLNNEKETHYLVMTVSEIQTEVINYLDSLIEDQSNPEDQPGTENDGSDTNNPENQPGTENDGSDTNNPENQPGTENDGSDTNNPEDQPGTENDGSDTNNPEDQSGTENDGSDTNNPEDQSGTENDGSDTNNPGNQPETGVNVKLPFIIGGGIAFIYGLCLLFKRRIIQK